MDPIVVSIIGCGNCPLDLANGTISINNEVIPVNFKSDFISNLPNENILQCLCCNALTLYKTCDLFETNTTEEDCSMCKLPLNTSCIQCVNNKNNENNENNESTLCQVIKSYNCGHQLHYHCWKNISSNKCPKCTLEWHKTQRNNDDEFNVKVILKENDQNNQVNLFVSKSWTINQLYESLNIDKSNYFIINKGKPLNDFDSLIDNTLNQDSVLCVCDTDKHSILYELTINYLDKTNKIPICSTAKFNDVREIVQKYYEISKEQQLYGFHTDDNTSLIKLEIKNETVITVTKIDGYNKMVDLFTDQFMIVNKDQIEPSTKLYGSVRNFINNIDQSNAGFESIFVYSVAWLPIVEQTKEGMSCFLSSLYVVSSYLSKLEDKSNKVLGLIRYMTNSSPTVLAFKLLFSKRIGLFKNYHKACIANGIYTIFKILIEGTNIQENRLFEYSRYILSYLLQEATSNHALTEIYNNVEINIGDETNLNKEYGVTNNICVPVWTNQNNTTSTENSIATNQADFKSNKKWKNIIMEVNDEHIMRIVSAQTISTAKAPCLTLNEAGNVVVFTNKGKSVESSISLYCPLAGSEFDTNVKTLVEKISLLPKEILNQQLDSTVIDNREPEEAIIVCFDTSSSMLGSSGFINENENKDDNQDVNTKSDSKKIKWLTDEESIEQNLLNRCIQKFRNHPNIFEFQKMASSKPEYALEILQRICRYEHDIGEIEFAQVMSM